VNIYRTSAQHSHGECDVATMSPSVTRSFLRPRVRLSCAGVLGGVAVEWAKSRDREFQAKKIIKINNFPVA